MGEVHKCQNGVLDLGIVYEVKVRVTESRLAISRAFLRVESKCLVFGDLLVNGFV